MVLKLRDLCLNFVAKEFKHMRNFDPRCLSSSQRELIIERLLTHDLLDLSCCYSSSKHRRSTTSSTSGTNDELDNQHKRDLIRCFFNGTIQALTLNASQHVNDDFVKMIRQFGASEKALPLRFRSLCINRCRNISGI